jgi:hypothetical protein
MRIGRFLTVGVVCTLAGLVPATSHALFHISVIDEVLASLDGDASQQFVEIEMRFAAQNRVANSVLAAFDANGVYVADILKVPDDVPNGQDGGRWTMATAEFQSAHAFTADFTMPAGIPLGGGMICWGAPGIIPPADPTSWDHSDPTNYVDCLAYGTYSGPSNRLIGTPTTLVAEGHGLARLSDSDDNAVDFACADVATPTDNAGASVDVAATTPCAAGRASGIQVTPDEQGVLVNKDVEAQRWTITRNLDDLTVTGNVFFPEGGDPLFLFCEQQGQVGDDLELRCSGTGSCSDTGCPDFDFIADVTLPEAFFEPPVEVAALAALIRDAARSAGSRAAASATGERTLGVAGRASGIQITPDQQRVLINKDVETQRWSITRNLDDLTVTGNVFFLEGGDPLFLFCEQQGQVGDQLDLRCSAADGCSDTGCPDFEFIADVTLPESFFALPFEPAPTDAPIADATPSAEPSPGATPQATPAAASPTPSPQATPTEVPEPAESPTPTPYVYPY